MVEAILIASVNASQSFFLLSVVSGTHKFRKALMSQPLVVCIVYSLAITNDFFLLIFMSYINSNSLCRLLCICDWILENQSKSHICNVEINGFKNSKSLL